MIHTAFAGYNIQRQTAYRPLKHNKQQSYKQGYAHCTHKHPHRFGKVASAISLSGKTAGTHTQKTKVPINKIKYTRTNGNAGNMIERQMAHYSHIHHTQKRNGDIGNYIRYSKLKYLFIHYSDKYIFAKIHFFWHNINTIHPQPKK